ncbi:SANT/Myb domain [Macleaya cordata]|uniref:SANT/Myb domain n=1 Tax=Macleaya cordata TaxID=56857 RepID=A0A200RBP2_MACCD|nr:SANT/Myb domain [Macleaya cordata]
MTLTDLSDDISPFPIAGNLIHSFQTSSETEFRSPLQKLRPVRNNQYAMEYSDFPTIVDSGMLPENEGSLIESLQYGDCHQVGVSPPSPEIEMKPPQKLLYTSRGGDKDLEEWNYSPANDTEGELLEKEGGGAGNRWPQEETLALLRIRSEMDAQFRDANPNGLLWEIVSRKLEQMGYHRDSKKCKEKFKNIYKYYKRTKERVPLKEDDCRGRKIYKFFSELKALDNQRNENPICETNFQDNTTTIQTPDPVESPINEVGLKTSSTDDLFDEFSSDDHNDDDGGGGGDDNYDELEEEIVEPSSRKRKRGTRHELKLYFENLVKDVMKKQEEMYKQLMETIEKMEKDRITREEAWKRQEMERRRRDKEMRDQETSRSLALISFIEKFLGQQIHNNQSPESYPEETYEQSEYKFDSSNKRWPKPEVQALITLRTSMEHKSENAVLKGPPLWEEISLAMSSMGYSRSAKKCKEKWENINKYFKRAMGNGKKWSENEKRCPYFRELDILYKKRLLNPEKPPDEMNDEGKERSANEEMLTTLAQVCNLFSMSEPLEPVGGQSGSCLV